MSFYAASKVNSANEKDILIIRIISNSLVDKNYYDIADALNNVNSSFTKDKWAVISINSIISNLTN